ncbi:MAG: sulfatase [Bryobacteraceae bacterium]
MPATRRTFLTGAAAAVVRRSSLGSATRPNILFAIADDQSWVHTGATGDPVVKTPAFDRVAQQGVLFRNAVSMSPGCAPSRAAILTGRSPWQLEEAGTHASYFPRKFEVFPDMLEGAGYFVGMTAKGAGPCNFAGAGWKRNPAGPAYSSIRLKNPSEGINPIDYAANFQAFLKQKPKDKPFYFWYGGTEPHRGYLEGSGVKSGKRLADATTPAFLPDAPEVRSDILDYLTEIEHFDRHLGAMLRALEGAGELENTLVIVTSDNGMPFPHSKATMYEYGIHLPLAVSWGARVKGGRAVDDLISFGDFAPTILEAAGLKPGAAMTGRSFLDVLASGKSGRVDAARASALSGRERHSHARYDNLGYPARAIRTLEYLYIRNFKPERWPAGDPEGYYDIDGGPTKSYMLAHRDNRLFEAGFGKHPAEELFDIRKDPACLENLAGKPEHEAARRRLRAELERTLTAQKDPRMLGAGDIWETYPRFSAMRPELGGFAKEGEYNKAIRPR